MSGFGFKDIIDILLVATIMFWFYRLLRKSAATNLFWGIILIVGAWFALTEVFHLELSGALLDRIISVGAIALIVIFQEEIRSSIYHLGSKMSLSDWRRHFLPKEDKEVEHYVGRITMACANMQKTKTGALIILEGDVSLREFADTGEKLDARVSVRLIENIFFKNTPLHDGALIISHGRLHSAGCILPVSKSASIPQHYGLRHRAALGIVERSDALAIVVSEETGNISVAQKGIIHEVTPSELTQLITSFLI